MKVPQLWRVKRAGKSIGALHVTVKGVRVNLATQDATVGRERAKEAVRGRRKFTPDASMRRPRASRVSTGDAMDTTGAERLIAALEGGPPPQSAEVGGVGIPAVADGAETPQARNAPPPPTEAQPTSAATGPDAAGWADDVHAAGSQTSTGSADAGADDAPAAPEVSDEVMADMAVNAQVWVAEKWAQFDVYDGFIAPPLPDEGRHKLATQWKTLITYTGFSAVIPPWVTGLLIPSVVLVTTTFAMAKGFALIAEQQRKEAGAPEKPRQTDDQPAAA
jgi:hypothetical protein